MSASLDLPTGMSVTGAVTPERAQILTKPALAFVADLTRTFRPSIRARLAARTERHARFAQGEQCDFLPETKSVREGDWKCAPLPADILDRRVEITGPVDRKMIINALNSGANVFMADLEDSNSPTWDNCIDGQVNLRDAATGAMEYRAPETGKHYTLKPDPAVLFVRPRGFHLEEAHVLVDGQSVPAMLVDFGLYFFHSAKALLARGTGPYFYLPKMESHLEARVWNEIFVHAQKALAIPQGSIKATCLIETLPGAFEMEEIVHELREHSAGLNCGRWDYIFSFIKTNGADASRVLPDRSLVGMTQPFMSAYSRMVIKVCHRRGVHAMGGMAAQIPIKNDPEANEKALAKVRADKLREVTDGHDGTWVAHPGLVGIAKEIFDEHMTTPNQIGSAKQADYQAKAADLLAAPQGARTEEALRHNLRVGVQYIEAWISGNGCVPLYSLMEDAATAEISRTQVWQWLTHSVTLDTGKKVDAALVTALLEEEMKVVSSEQGEARMKEGRWQEAKKLLIQTATESPLVEFLTLPAYDLIK